MGIFSKNREKMDLLQKAQENLAKTQENLEMTQKNLSLLAGQNQEATAENQDILQRTLTSIESMLGTPKESIPHEKEYSKDEKERAAYALNCCTISVSQIVDYDDIYVLEQEYESILNNLNLENMPKDEALLDIYKQLLDTITFFRIQEGDKAMLEQEYQHKIKNAIWSAVPQISLAGLATNPIGAAINLATQVGIGYMNYRREKAEIQSEQEKQKWQLTRSAMEQFNGLRRELFTTAWRLADEYKFADNLRITEQQITIFNKILLEPDDLKRYERLNYIKDNFEAYTPFWYHLGNAAYKASQSMCEADAKKYQNIARDNYEKYKKKTNDAKLNLFRQDHIRAACAMELFELNGKQEGDIYLLDMAKEAAGNNFDVLEICALHYLQFENTKKTAKEILRMLVNENYNAVVNGQILSSIYVSEYIKNPENLDEEARHNHETLQTRVNPAYLFPMPATPSADEAHTLETVFLAKQKACLLQKYNSVLKELIGKYTLKFNKSIPIANQESADTQWYFSDDPKAVKNRIRDIEQVFRQNREDQFVRNLGFAISEMLDVLNELCVTMEVFPYANGSLFASKVQREVASHKDGLNAILDKVVNIQFKSDDISLLFKNSFSDFTGKAFSAAAYDIRKEIVNFSKMEEISIAETHLRHFCVQNGLNVPILVLNTEDIAESSHRKARYISINMLDMDKKELSEEINRVREMKEIISNFIQSKQLIKLKEKGKMIVLTSKDAKFEIYCNNNLPELYNSSYFGEPLLIICHEKAKKSLDDLVFTTKGIVHFEKGKIKHKEWIFGVYIYPPIKYTSIKNKKDGIHIGNHIVDYNSNIIETDSLYELIQELRIKEKVAKGSEDGENSQSVVKSNLADIIEEILLMDLAKLSKEANETFVENPLESFEEAENLPSVNQNKNGSASVSEDPQIYKLIHLNKVITEKNSYGELVIEGTVISEKIELSDLCRVETRQGIYRINHINRLDCNGMRSSAAQGETIEVSLAKQGVN